MKLKVQIRKKEKELHCSAVIVAAGSSTRMGQEKTLMELCGVPVIVRTLLAFESCAVIDEIIVVTGRDRITDIADLCKKYTVSKVTKVISGGKTRMESSLAGVSAVKEDARYIAIHDGARPLITPELIEETVRAATLCMGAAPGIRSTDTLKAVNKRGFAVGTVDRDTTVRIQTPQVFKADLIKGALTRAVRKELPLTDDCAAAETMGVRILVVEGDENNIKLTTPRDVNVAEMILKERGEGCE